MKRTRVTRLLITFLLALPLTQHATVMVPMFMDDLTASSQTVVHGSIIAKRAEWGADRRMIYTVYTVEPRQYLKGALGSTFEMREPGGELDGEGFYVASVPQFEVGQEAVLFVWTDKAGQHQLTAFEQGAVQVVESSSGVKSVARQIPLGTARAGVSNNALVSTASEATISRPSVALSERSLSGLLNQIRISISRTQPAAE